MTLRLEINGVDFTSFWRVYESRWTMRAWNGEAFASSFVLDDDGTISHANLAARKIVEVWENASGSDVCLYRGRVSNKHLGQGPSQVHNDMRWVVEAEDCNVELRGIRVNNAVRPTETDEVRFEAIRVAFLNGAASTHADARDSTDMDNTYLGQGVAVNLEAETYTDTDPMGVFNRIVEVSGRTYFVTLTDAGAMELYYGDHTDESYKSDIEITDAGFADSADDIDVYAAYRGPNAGEHNGQRVLTGGAVRWGDGNLYEDSDINGAEAVYDKWEETFTNEWVQHETQADNILNKLVGLSDEDFTYIATIDMQPQHVHRLRAGMMVLLTRFRANKPTQGYVRCVQMQVEPAILEDGGNPIYRVHLDLGRAQGRRLIPRGRHRPGPYPPSSGTPGTCTRLYFSDATSTLDSTAPTVDAAWDSTTGATTIKQLKATADSTFGSTGSHSSSAGDTGGGAAVDVLYGRFAILMDSSLAATLAAGGATVVGHARARARFGVGISEAAQDVISQMTVKVSQGASSTIRGTALSPHALVSSSGAAKWPAQSTPVNRVFPATPADDTLSAVSGAAAGDYLLIEIGARSFTDDTSGGRLYYTNNSATDLPENETETTALNSWIDICTGDEPGDTTSPTVPPGSGSPGSSNIYAPIDHEHEHGVDDENFQHEAVDVDYDPTTSGLEAGNVQEAVDALAAGIAGAYVLASAGGEEDLNTVAASGSTETIDLSTGNGQDITLSDNCTFTFPSVTDARLCSFTLLLRQDGTGSRTATWPGSVEWPGGTAPTLSTAANSVDILSFLTVDGGATWFGAYSGSPPSVLDADDVRDAGRWEVVVSGTPATEVTTEDTTDWVYGWIPG